MLPANALPAVTASRDRNRPPSEGSGVKRLATIGHGVDVGVGVYSGCARFVRSRRDVISHVAPPSCRAPRIDGPDMHPVGVDR